MKIQNLKRELIKSTRHSSIISQNTNSKMKIQNVKPEIIQSTKHSSMIQRSARILVLARSREK